MPLKIDDFQYSFDFSIFTEIAKDTAVKSAPNTPKIAARSAKSISAPPIKNPLAAASSNVPANINTYSERDFSTP